MIKIKKSETADTRTCDWTKVTMKMLYRSSVQHRKDVAKGMIFLADKLKNAGISHDWSKIENPYLELFFKDFKTGFKKTDWWKLHQDKERHHLKDLKYIQEDVNLIDLLEMIVDGVMAGLARSGEYRKEDIPEGLLEKAFNNTIQLLLNNVEVK